jgi:hypothetical protein
MNQPLIPSQGSGKPTEASPRSHPAERAELRLRTRAILYGILAAAILSGLIAWAQAAFTGLMPRSLATRWPRSSPRLQ